MKASSDPPEPTTFAELIADRDVRTLAAAAGVSVTSVYKWKHGTFLPGIDILPEIARATGWPLQKLTTIVVREQAARKKARR
jgi:hypothetical protein